jgi:hypothetical protein
MEETTREEEQEEAIGNCYSMIPLEIGFICWIPLDTWGSFSYLYETWTVVEGKAENTHDVLTNVSVVTEYDVN